MLSYLDMAIFALQTALPGLRVAPAHFAHDFRRTTTLYRPNAHSLQARELN